MATRSRQEKDRALATILGIGKTRPRLSPSKPMLSKVGHTGNKPTPAGPVQNIDSGMFDMGALGATGMEPGSDAWAANTGGLGALLWRALVRKGPYEAIEWSQGHPGLLTGGMGALNSFLQGKAKHGNAG